MLGSLWCNMMKKYSNINILWPSNHIYVIWEWKNPKRRPKFKMADEFFLCLLTKKLDMALMNSNTKIDACCQSKIDPTVSACIMYEAWNIFTLKSSMLYSDVFWNILRQCYSKMACLWVVEWLGNPNKNERVLQTCVQFMFPLKIDLWLEVGYFITREEWV